MGRDATSSAEARQLGAGAQRHGCRHASECDADCLTLPIGADVSTMVDDQEVLDDLPESNNSFLDMMSDDVGIKDINLTVNGEPLEISPLTKKKRSRTSNYSTTEDEAFVRAWEYVSLDPITGNDQDSLAYWYRIADQYNHNVESSSTRTTKSLQQCWCGIQVCCNRWAGCMEAVELNSPSGTAIQDQVPIAQALYKQKDKKTHKAFSMLHYWQLLKDNEKWRNRNNVPFMRKQKSSTPDNDNDEPFDEDDDEGRRSPTPGSRPRGRKQSKEMAKKEDKGAMYKEVLQEMIVTRKELEAEKQRDKKDKWMELKAIEEHKVAIKEEKWIELKAIEERKVAIKEERLRIEKDSEDNKIMFMDISTLDATQKAYVEAKRAQILASVMNFTMGGDFNLRGGSSGAM